MKRTRDVSSATGVDNNRPTPPANQNAPQVLINPGPQPTFHPRSEAPNGTPRSDQNIARPPTNAMSLPFICSRSEARRNADREAALALAKLADAGDGEAQCELGLAYAKGRGVEKIWRPH
jgi:TPR repeat protein